jgi:hypothetical protein
MKKVTKIRFRMIIGLIVTFLTVPALVVLLLYFSNSLAAYSVGWLLVGGACLGFLISYIIWKAWEEVVYLYLFWWWLI